MLNNANEVKFAFIERTTPSYASEKFVRGRESGDAFDDMESFQRWFDDEVTTHGNFVLNKTHPTGKNPSAPYQVKTVHWSLDPQPAKRRRTVNKVSKRSACPAKLTVKELNNGTVEVDYEWVHLNHDPADWDEVAAEALDQGTKEWLKKQVDNEMNWTSISALLRLNDDEMDMLEGEIEERRRFPKMMAVNYRAVQNLVLSKINRVSKKHFVDKTSVGLWMDYLANEKGCTTLSIFTLKADRSWFLGFPRGKR
ncbi:hypothetical protein, partial, partial [Absidia glauca]